MYNLGSTIFGDFYFLELSSHVPSPQDGLRSFEHRRTESFSSGIISCIYRKYNFEF